MSQSPYLRHGAAEAMLRIVRDREQRHVRAVARTEDAEPVAVDPVERAEVVGGGEAVLRVAHAPVAVVEPLEVAAVPGRAAEVDRQPRVALVDEVLRVPVPLVAVAARRAAVRVDDRRHRRSAEAPGGRNRNAWISVPSNDVYVTSSGRTCGAARTARGAGACSVSRSCRRRRAAARPAWRHPRRCRAARRRRPVRRAPRPALGDDRHLTRSRRRP